MECNTYVKTSATPKKHPAALASNRTRRLVDETLEFITTSKEGRQMPYAKNLQVHLGSMKIGPRFFGLKRSWANKDGCF
ncbi:hypothetical protein AJ80_06944 [Polytolypa hystricis UAMH7299]|uniref:Uncharacterized protein n=1 Tax=Polytolypa hystricis (strain UAMH7299) TaxID=1447883 RepID=A0A2B7XSE2_POLH7|nr:hypothetical protein AJ80_06944 [Polytolypa hystricis UAMH7299]